MMMMTSKTGEEVRREGLSGMWRQQVTQEGELVSKPGMMVARGMVATPRFVEVLKLQLLRTRPANLIWLQK